MQQYKTGELAKIANVTIRTIRYYDKIGLLKPSKIASNGYRYYTEFDYFKLQKILSLKYLGFSLEDIFSMTINDTHFSIQDSLEMQTKLIKQKIEHLKRIELSLEQTTKLIVENNSDIDWSNILKTIKISELDRSLVEQYKNASNVSIRIQLHDKYSQNKLSWFEWLFKQYEFETKDKVLEIGCGNGYLWKINKDLLNKDLSLVLSDISEGMLIDAKENLIDINNHSNELNGSMRTKESSGSLISCNIEYNQFDFQQIPYPNESFDKVIANHALFYAKDLNKVLSEVFRVLKKDGIFYCSTYGKKHMKEITDIVKEFDSRIVLSEINLFELFGLDDGKDILTKYFKDINLVKYDDYLLVNNKDDLIDYILSCHGNQTEYILKDYANFKKFINNKFRKNKAIRISKDSGMFICKK